MKKHDISESTTIPPKSCVKAQTKEEEEVLSKPPPGVGTWISARFGLAYLAFFGFVNVYALRVNLSVAILSMVNSSYLLPTHNVTGHTCPENPNQVNHTGGEFNWDGHDRGQVLGAFFYGYILTQLPGGYLASRIGGKLLFGGGVLCTSVLTLLTPIAARTSYSLLIAVRILAGVGEGVTFPAMHAMWGVWAPPIERSRLVSLTYAGCHFGTVIAQPLAGVLCSSNIMGGWPSVFYLFGIVGIIWCFTWFLLAKNYPREYKRISKKELEYIEANVQPVDKSIPIPWKDIALSKPMWAISIAHFSNNWGFYTLLTCLPLYLKDVLRFDITQDGLVSALPYLVMWISINLSGIVADKLREKGILNTTQTRKTFNTIGLIGPAVFLIVAGFVGCNKIAAISCICLATMFNGFNFSGFNSNHIDIASRYAGILMGISNTWATIPGFVSPAVVGALTGKNPSRENWMYVFYIAAGVYVVGAVLYVILASGVEQDWNRIEKSDSDETKYLIDDKNNEGSRYDEPDLIDN